MIGWEFSDEQESPKRLDSAGIPKMGLKTTVMLRRREERGGRRARDTVGLGCCDPVRLDRQSVGVLAATRELQETIDSSSLDSGSTTDADAVLAAVRKLSVSISSESSREVAVSFGVHTQAARLLTLWLPHVTPIQTHVMTPDRVEALQDVLVLLRDLCGGIADEGPFRGPGVIIALFGLMEVEPLFERAAALAEELLANRKRLFEASVIPNFTSLALSRTPAQLAAFSRVLAVMCFEPEETRYMEEDPGVAFVSCGVGLLQVSWLA